MSHLPHACPLCGSGTTTAGPCDACNRTAETQPEQVFQSAPEQNNVQGEDPRAGIGPFPYFPVDEAAPVPLEAWEKLQPREPKFSDFIEGSFDLTQDCRECGTRLTSKNRVDVKEFEELCYTCYKKKPKHVCVDLDGVLAEYDGWKGPQHIGPPRDGARGFLKALVATGYKVVIHTTRQAPVVKDWLQKFDMIHLVSKVTSEKLPALAYLDDRSVCFEGDFEAALRAIKSFTPYWRREKA